MNSHAMPFLLAATLGLALVANPKTVHGQVIEFADVEIFFEFNATDLDLGLQIFFDAPGWEMVEVRGPDGKIFEVTNDGNLQSIGSTELFTESAEPGLDEGNLEQSIADFLAQFPAGEYTFEGMTTAGETLLSTAELTHDLPAAPGLLFPDPAAETNVLDPENTVVEWFDASTAGDPEVILYEVIVELEEVNLSAEFLADPEATSQRLSVPREFFGDFEPLVGKVEVLAQEESGNKTITEVGFVPEPATAALMALAGILMLPRRR